MSEKTWQNKPSSKRLCFTKVKNRAMLLIEFNSRFNTLGLWQMEMYGDHYFPAVQVEHVIGNIYDAFWKWWHCVLKTKPTLKQAIRNTVIHIFIWSYINLHMHLNARLKQNMQMHLHMLLSSIQKLLNLMSCFCVGRQALADAAHFRDSAATPKQLVVDVYLS